MKPDDRIWSYGFAGSNMVWLVVSDKLLRTTDDGQHWDTLYKADLDPPSGVTFVDEQHAWMIVDGTLKATTDGGQHWVSQALDTSLNAYTGFDFISSQQGWITLGDTVYPSPDTGSPWQAFHTLLATTDGGATWHTVNPHQQPVWSVQFFDAQHGWGFLTNEPLMPDPALGYTSDGGQTWLSRVSPDCRWSKGRGKFSFSGPTTAWAACGPDLGSESNASDLYQTMDGGATWQHVRPLDTGTPGEDILGVDDLFFLDDLHGWILIWTDNSDSRLRTTTDGGRTWQTVAPFTQSLDNLRFASPLRGYAVMNLTTLIGTQDGGATWTPLYSTTPP